MRTIGPCSPNDFTRTSSPTVGGHDGDMVNPPSGKSELAELLKLLVGGLMSYEPPLA
jgi:hypothetical protein